jgi:hypothetical protein
MATTATGPNPISLPGSDRTLTRPAEAVSLRRRRKMSYEAGRGIEILGHAIQYLADEFALDCMDRSARSQAWAHPRLQAIDLLMASNREIYLSCPVAPTLAERLGYWLHWRRI